MNTTSIHTATGTRIVGVAAVVLAILVSALGAWFNGAGSALAPEPARLTSNLNGGNGAAAAAVYPNGSPTIALIWPATLTSGSIAVGTPCSNVPLTNGQTTSKVIAAVGTLRKCS